METIHIARVLLAGERAESSCRQLWQVSLFSQEVNFFGNISVLQRVLAAAVVLGADVVD